MVCSPRNRKEARVLTCAGAPTEPNLRLRQTLISTLKPSSPPPPLQSHLTTNASTNNPQ